MESAKSTGIASILNSGLEPYTGPWEWEQAAHLLRRTTFGPNLTQIEQAISDGLDLTVDQILTDLPPLAPPVNYFFEDDPNVPIGETWVDKPYVPGVANIKNAREKSLFGWVIQQFLNEGVSVRMTMFLFWHNHFVIGGITEPLYNYHYVNLLIENGTGNFRDFVKAITIAPGMLRYLNGNQNTKEAPNENYARELLELFTIGKGDQVAQGDYTNYTEDDVIAMAKVLTGWQDVGFSATDPNPIIGAEFIPADHDESTKQLSYRFDNQTVENAGILEYENLVDLILEKQEVARFICRKFYRWFVYYDINPTIESEIIEPLAQIMIDNDYEIKPVLETLFKSAHFYESTNIGAIIKNPMSLYMSLFKPLNLPYPDPATDLYDSYEFGVKLILLGEQLEMEVLRPPSVAGWKAYYQAPLYYRHWINSSTLQWRFNIQQGTAGEGFPYGGYQMRCDVLALAATIPDATDPNILVETLAKVLLPRELSTEQFAAAKEALLGGLPDFEWTVEYIDYLSDPGNIGLALSIEGKLRALLQAILGLPEFQLS